MVDFVDLRHWLAVLSILANFQTIELYMPHELRFVSVLIGSTLFGGLNMSSAGLAQELSVERPSGGAGAELSRQKKTSGELPTASGFQDLLKDKEPPLPYVEPKSEKPVVAAKPTVEPVKVEPKPKAELRPAKKIKKAKKTAKKAVRRKVAPTPSSTEGKVRIIPIEEIPIVGIEVVSDTDEPTTPQSSERRQIEKVDRN